MTHPRTTQACTSRSSYAARAVLAAVAAGLLALLGVATSSPAQAADAYRYWTYWDAGSTGAWTFATTTADAEVPKDGTVDGWRFEIAGEAADTARPPRIAPDFTAICAGSPAAPAGQKRVAVVIDYGTEADSPDGTVPPTPDVECVTVPEKATSAQALTATGKVRSESGMICGIEGYPAAGCGDVVPNATVPPTGEPTLPVPVAASASASVPAGEAAAPTAEGSSSTPWGVIVGVVVIVALGLAAFALSRRSRG